MQVESYWREIEAAWGLLDSDGVMNVLHLPGANDAEVLALRARGRLLAIELGGVQMYPGFQFDYESGLVKPVVADLVKLAHEVNWAHDDFVVWLCSPCGYFNGDRPVDHLHEHDDLLEKARNAATVEW